LIVDSVLANAKAYLNKEVVDCSIAIEMEKSSKSQRTQMPNADEKVNLQNTSSTGLIDSHVHLKR